MSSHAAKDVYPLSPMQQGMLFQSLSGPASDVYVEQLSCRLYGHSRSRRSWPPGTRSCRRHAVLRTAFAWRGLPEPLQVVGPQVRLPFERLDWRDVPGEVREQRLREVRVAERLQGFELARAP